jgi:four helix bundle protein
MSMSNNIAEGSGSNSKTEFRNFLNIARRSTFEVVNILVILNMRNLIDQETIDFLFNRLETLSRKTTQFQRSLQ